MQNCGSGIFFGSEGFLTAGVFTTKMSLSPVWFSHKVMSDKKHRLFVTLSCFRPDRFMQNLNLLPILFPARFFALRNFFTLEQKLRVWMLYMLSTFTSSDVVWWVRLEENVFEKSLFLCLTFLFFFIRCFLFCSLVVSFS